MGDSPPTLRCGRSFIYHGPVFVDTVDQQDCGSNRRRETAIVVLQELRLRRHGISTQRGDRAWLRPADMVTRISSDQRLYPSERRKVNNALLNTMRNQGVVPSELIRSGSGRAFEYQEDAIEYIILGLQIWRFQPATLYFISRLFNIVLNGEIPSIRNIFDVSRVYVDCGSRTEDFIEILITEYQAVLPDEISSWRSKGSKNGDI